MQQIVGVILGIIMACLLLSIMASHIQELYAAYFSSRSVILATSVETMLADPDLARSFFQHPLIQSMSRARPFKVTSNGESICRPTYIPPEIFRKVLQVVLSQTYSPGLTTVPELISRMPDSPLRSTFEAITLGTGNEVARVAAIERWYSDAMDRVGGLYKRKTQRSLLVVGFLLAVVFNVSMIRVTVSLWNSVPASDQAIALAQRYADAGSNQPSSPTDTATLLSAQGDLKTLPVGWTATEDWWHKGPKTSWLSSFFFHVSGWIITAVAVSFGSPFWFDLLNKVINPRIAGSKPQPEQSPG